MNSFIRYHKLEINFVLQKNANALQKNNVITVGYILKKEERAP